MLRFLVVPALLAACSSSPAAISPDGDTGDDAAAEVVGAACAGWTTLRHLSATELHDKLASTDPILIDIRVPSTGGIPGTDADIAYSDVDAMAALIGPDPCADVVIYCVAGNRSAVAGAELVARGYLRVQDLAGGITAWQQAGYQVE